MSELIYKKGSLFESDATHLVHACNCQGAWGGVGGIAGEFKKLYPKAYKIYAEVCNLTEPLGSSIVIADHKRIVCLFTSQGYGNRKDSVGQIVESTKKALHDFFQKLQHKKETHFKIASPKFNAGLFDVPWEITEDILARNLAMSKKQITWEIWEL